MDRTVEQAVVPEDLKIHPWGCFYRCLVFDGNPKEVTEDRVVVNIDRLLELYPADGFPEIAERAAESHARAARDFRERIEKWERKQKPQGLKDRLVQTCIRR